LALSLKSQRKLASLFNFWYIQPNPKADEALAFEFDYRFSLENYALNIFLKIGKYLDKRFPEKITAEEVHNEIQAIKQESALSVREIKVLLERVHSLEKMFEDFKKIKEEVSLMKTQSNMKSRLAGNVPDNMTAFAQRLSPVQPAGGNRSPQ
jgi:hypothetical protein